MAISENYSRLEGRARDLLHLQYATSTLAWDMRTYMPSKGIEQRGTALSILQRMIHEQSTDPKIGAWINQAKNDGSLNEEQKREVLLWDRMYSRETKVPAGFVEKLTKQTMETEHLWIEAKRKSNFKMVQPHLAEVVALLKQKAHFVDPNRNPWDVLGDEFEPEVSAEQITYFFEPLREGLISLIKKYQNAIQDCNNVPELSLLDSPATLEELKRLTTAQFEFLGLDPSRCRADESAHPFTTGVLNDVRFTTHYVESQAMASFFATFHEAGHALYDLNLPSEWAWTFRGQAVSSGIHESQSRFIENLVGRNPAFLKYYLPIIQKSLSSYRVINESQFLRAVNAITKSKIRIYADEVTYGLHIILRFEIERDLFNDKVSVAELPEVWNEKMEKYLGQKIDNDAEGVLQDTHWYAGLFGYFPDYALGNLYNAQMLHIMKQDIPEWEEELGKGNVKSVTSWLAKNVQGKGNMHDPLPFIQKITGEPLNPHYFLDYLELKFGTLFNF